MDEKSATCASGPAERPDANSIAVAAQRSGISRSLMYEYATGDRKPALKTLKVGRRRLVLEEDRLRWLQAMRD